jgi:tetratricopeptide (TPR) repeat protein
MSLGQRIRELRESRGLTQAQLAGREFTKGFISLLERDRAKPSLDSLAVLARRLGTSVDALLAGEGNPADMAAHALLMLARRAAEREDLDEADQYLQMAEVLARRHGLAEADREIRVLRATHAVGRRDYDAAWAALEDARPVMEQAGDHWRLGRVLSLMGLVQLRRRQFAQSRQLLEQALVTLRAARAGRDPARVDALISLGSVLVYLGRLEEARRRYEEAASSYVASRDLRLRGKALWGLGVVLRNMRQYDQARRYLLDARDAFEAAEDLENLMRVTQNLGRAFLEDGQPREALRHLEHALRVADRLNRPTDRASILTELARAWHAVGETAQALDVAGRALEAAQRAGDPVEVAEAKVVQSRVLLAARQVQPAVAALREAVAGFAARDMRQRMRELAREFGPLLIRQGAHAEAAELMVHALDELAAESSRSTPTRP